MSAPPPHVIVPAGPGDAADLARVHVTSWRETYAGLLPSGYLDRLSEPLLARRWRRRLTGGEVTLLADGPGGAVGYCTAAWSRHAAAEAEAEINTIYLVREVQGLGLGRALLSSAVRVMAARGATSLIIGVLRDNEPARGFYERLGGRCEDGAGDWVAGRTVATVDYRWADLAPLLAG
jgi:ribosomal protein S18 acetylase RimI-like enzyme